jgi:hypothetical protein
MRYCSDGDERAFFTWLKSISGVLSAEGCGRDLHIRLRSNRLSAQSLREFIALYKRYRGDMRELAQFSNSSNASWFAVPEAAWHKQIFG